MPYVDQADFELTVLRLKVSGFASVLNTFRLNEWKISSMHSLERTSF